MPNPTFPNVAVHNDSTNVNWKSLNSYNTTAAWHSDQYGQSDDDVLSYNGTWTNDVAITSNYANQQMPVDAARNLTIKVSAQAWVKYLETVTVSWEHINPYSGTLSAETTIQPINLEYNVTTSSLGAWTFTQKTETAKLPPMQDDPSNPGQKQLKLKGQNEKGDALEVKTNITGTFFNRGTFNWQALMNQITDGLTPVAQSIWAMCGAGAQARCPTPRVTAPLSLRGSPLIKDLLLFLA